MANEPSLKFHASLVLWIAGLAAVPALWSFGSAIYSAATTGNVMVLSIGRYETYRVMVPWAQGWARFVGPWILVGALCLCATRSSEGKWWWISAALALAGFAMLLFSSWFVSLGKAAAFILGNGFIALCFYVDNRFGRTAAFVFMLVTVLTVVFLFFPR